MRLLPRMSMHADRPRCRMSWYSCALASSAGPVNGVSGLAAESGAGVAVRAVAVGAVDVRAAAADLERIRSTGSRSSAYALCANRPATTMAMSLTFMIRPLVSAQEELAVGGCRRVAAVDLPMAFDAATAYEADVRRQHVGQRPASVVDPVRVAVRVAVAAERRRLLREQARVRRAVRRVAVAQFSSTGGCSWIHGPRLSAWQVTQRSWMRLVAQARLLQRAVRVVAVLAADLAFDDRVVRGLDDLAADVAVAPDARLVGELALPSSCTARPRTASP